MNLIQPTASKSRLTLSRSFVLAAVVILVMVYLTTEHVSHTLAALPYLLILLCPLMHLFMHRGGHGGGHDGSHGKPPAQGSDKE